MKHLLRFTFLALLFSAFCSSGFAQTVTRTYLAPSSTSVDGVGNYGHAFPSVSFTQGDFTAGCAVTDVNVTINWAKTAGTCSAPTGGNSAHAETSYRINGPTGNTEILALPGTWSGGATISSVTTTFSDGNPVPSGTPISGTFGPNNGVLSDFNGLSPFGAWNLDAGDNAAGAPLCVTYYEVTVTTAPDVTAPVLSMPADITVNSDAGACGTTVSFTAPTATDNCSATVTQTAGPASGSFFSGGTTTVSFDAADPYGNVSSGSFTVTVVDAEDPVISCPGTVFAGCDTIISYAAPVASDNCPGVAVSLVSGPASGGIFQQGTTAVTYVAADLSGNSATCSFDVIVDTESSAPTSVTASSQSVCAGSPTTLTVNGGALGTNAQWYWYIGSCGGQLVGAGSSIVVSPLSTANYFVRAEGPCNATTCVDILIDVTAAPSVGFSGINSPSACGAADGTITAVATGGTAPYVFSWSNGAVGATISGLAAAPYEVTVTDDNGCTDFSSISLNDPSADVVFLTSSDADNIICEGETVTFTATGAFQYQYYIDGVPVSTQNPFVTNSLQDGQTVYVTGTDFNFCSYTTQGINFTVLDNPVIAETVTDPSACATSDGTIMTSVSGGLPPYIYSWSNGSSSANVSGLPAGPYLVTVTDDNGCSTNETYALNDPGAAAVNMASSEDPDNEICAGESITFTASGSVDYEFFVDGQSVSTTNPYATASLTNGQSVAATGTDVNNCTATSNIIIPIVNPGPVVSLMSDVPSDTICIGQSISFFASGGLTYEFFVDGVSQGPASTTSVFVSSALTNGQVVTVVATDAFQCDVESAGITVTVNPSPTVTITSSSDPTSCGATDGSVTAEASGGTPGYTYAWSTGQMGASITSLNAGSYFVLATDNAGCTDATSASLSDVGSSPVSMVSSDPNDTICGGDEVIFTAAGASTYVFFVNGVQMSTQNPFVIDSLIDGDIIAVTGLDTQLCAATSAPITYTVHPEIEVGIISFINPSACGATDGVANAITIGGVPTFDYLWTGGQTTPSAVNLAAGQYVVSVTDANGCQSIDAVSLSDPGSFMVSLTATPPDLTICEGTEISFTASGGNSFEFFLDGVSVATTNPYLNATLHDGETVAATGTDANNCTSTSPGLTYHVNSVPSVSLSLPTMACSNIDTVEFTGGFPIGGSYTVIYNGFPIIGDLFFPSLAESGAVNVDYTYTATNGCPGTASANYIVLPAPAVDLGNDTTVCALTLDAGAGYVSYEWTPDGQVTPTISVSMTDAYGVSVEDGNGCVGTDEIVVTVNPIPDPVITPGGVVEFCVGDSILLTGPGGFSAYSWSNGSSDQSTTIFGSDTVTLTVTNQYGCDGSADVVTIMNQPQAGAIISADGPLEFCLGESVTLNAGPGYASYLWNSGSTTQTINVIESGEYTVVVLDGNGCIDSSMTADPVIVTVWDPLPLLQESGDSLTITNPVGFVTYQWYLNGNEIAGATSDVYVIEESGNYMVCVVDDQGCEGCSSVWEMTYDVGIKESFFDGQVNVYPNPNNGQFIVDIALQHQMDLHIGLYDLVGKQIWTDDAIGQTSEMQKQYDLSDLPDGVYVLRIYADDQMTVQKIIKQQ